MALFWIIIIILAGLFWFFWKTKHMKHRIYSMFVVLLLIFLLISGTKFISDTNLKISSLKGMLTAGKLYFSWLGNLFGNLKTIAGNAINMNWGNFTK